ncbi:hypothetical protein F5B20DRAFT_587511, partial [Whalleya microplaca]
AVALGIFTLYTNTIAPIYNLAALPLYVRFPQTPSGPLDLAVIVIVEPTALAPVAPASMTAERLRCRRPFFLSDHAHPDAEGSRLSNPGGAPDRDRSHWVPLPHRRSRVGIADPAAHTTRTVLYTRVAGSQRRTARPAGTWVGSESSDVVGRANLLCLSMRGIWLAGGANAACLTFFIVISASAR